MTKVKLTAEELQKVKKDVLREHEHYLCEELGDPGRYFAYLRSKSILTQSDCDTIGSQGTTELRVGQFVRTLSTQRGENNVSSFDVFVEALKKQRVQAHVATTLMKAFAKRKAEKEREKASLSGQPGTPGRAHSDSPVVTPVQATSSAFHSRSHSHEPPSSDSPHKAPPTSSDGPHKAPPTSSDGPHRAPPTSSVPPGQPQYEIHPEHGPMPYLPPERRPPSPPEASENMHPEYGVLPPSPPPAPSSSSFVPAGQSEGPGKIPQLLDPPEAQPTSHAHSQWSATPPVLSPPQWTPEVPPTGHTPSQWSPATEGKYTAHLRHQMNLPERPSQGVGDGGSGTMKLWEDRVRALERENQWWQRKSKRLEKELEETKEKLRSVTLSYRSQSHTARQQSGSNLDDYAQLLEESGKLQKEAAEKSSRIESLEQENWQLREQLDTLHRSLPRPQHLPIFNPSASNSHPSPGHDLAMAEETPGLTPARSVHAGDSMLRHRMHLQSSPSPKHRHHGSGGEGAQLTRTSLNTSSTSISSGNEVKFSHVNQATLV